MRNNRWEEDREVKWDRRKFGQRAKGTHLNKTCCTASTLENSNTCGGLAVLVVDSGERGKELTTQYQICLRVAKRIEDYALWNITMSMSCVMEWLCLVLWIFMISSWMYISVIILSVFTIINVILMWKLFLTFNILKYNIEAYV